MKRALACVLAFCLILTVLPFSLEVQAADTSAETSGTCGENLTWVYDDATGTLRISGTGDMYDYCEKNIYGNPYMHDFPAWLNTGGPITKVIIEEGVTSIGVWAFWMFTDLEEVVIPKSVTRIEIGAFEQCSMLRHIQIPPNVTTINYGTFMGCESLEEITIPSDVISINGNALLGCTSLRKVSIPSTVMIIDTSAFSGCSSLAHVSYYGSERQWLDIQIKEGNEFLLNAERHYVENMERPAATSGTCGDNLTWSFEEVTGKLTISGIGRMPNYCDMPSDYLYVFTNTPWNEAGLNQMIKEVSVEEGVTHIGAYAFVGCSNMAKIKLPSSVTSMGFGAFQYCTNLKMVTLPDGLETIPSCGFDGCNRLAQVETPDSLVNIYSQAFRDCANLTEIIIPHSVKEIGYEAFNGCDNLSDVYFLGTLEEWAQIKIWELNDPLLNARIHYGENPIPECTEHSYSVWAVVTAPNCTEIGVENRICTKCGATEEREIAATGHIWDDGRIMREPTEDTEGEMTYTCGHCGETRTEAVAKLDHVHKYTEAVTAPTCTEGGYTTYTCACGDSYQDKATSALGHSFAEGTCTVCGTVDPDWVEPEPGVVRLAGGHRYETAFLAADRMKVTLGVDKFDAVVVASGTNFADALSGSYLAAVKNAPILLASGVDWVDALVKDYIKENLTSGGTVYILGGTSAVPAAFETGLDGFNVKRLAGGDRFDTNLKVLSEAGTGDKPILVCTGLSFADSLSASAAELPILLVWNKLTDDQKTIVEALARNGNDFIIIGGESAVSKDMENQIAAYGVEVERVAGGNRFETSVAIAERFFDAPESAVLAYAWNFPDGLCGGPLAATMDAPLILTMDKYEAKAAAYIRENAIQNGVILGGTGLISDKTVETIFE